MPKDTKSLDNNKAPACESRGFVHKKKKACILTHLLFLLPREVTIFSSAHKSFEMPSRTVRDNLFFLE